MKITKKEFLLIQMGLDHLWGAGHEFNQKIEKLKAKLILLENKLVKKNRGGA